MVLFLVDFPVFWGRSEVDFYFYKETFKKNLSVYADLWFCVCVCVCVCVCGKF